MKEIIFYTDILQFWNAHITNRSNTIRNLDRCYACVFRKCLPFNTFNTFRNYYMCYVSTASSWFCVLPSSIGNVVSMLFNILFSLEVCILCNPSMTRLLSWHLSNVLLNIAWGMVKCSDFSAVFLISIVPNSVNIVSSLCSFHKSSMVMSSLWDPIQHDEISVKNLFFYVKWVDEVRCLFLQNHNFCTV